MLAARILAWFGRQSVYVLPVGCAAALAAPELAAWLRPALPALSALVLAVAAARMDLRALLAQGVGLREGAGLLAVLAGPAAALSLIAPEGLVGPVLVYALAPPIAGAASLCYIMGFDAPRALRWTVLGTLAAPLAAPIGFALLGASAAPDPLELALRLFGVVGLGLAAGAAARAVVGPQRIEARSEEMNGVAALVMVLFVVPIFDGVGALALGDPVWAAGMFALAVALNFGGALVAWAALRRRGKGLAGAGAVSMGNRNTGLLLAVLPPDPGLSLFVAFYQAPMYATPLVARWLGVGR